MRLGQDGWQPPVQVLFKKDIFFTFTRTANAPRTMSEAQTPTEIAEDTTPDSQTNDADDEREEAVRALKDLERKYPMLSNPNAETTQTQTATAQ